MKKQSVQLQTRKNSAKISRVTVLRFPIPQSPVTEFGISGSMGLGFLVLLFLLTLFTPSLVNTFAPLKRYKTCSDSLVKIQRCCNANLNSSLLNLSRLRHISYCLFYFWKITRWTVLTLSQSAPLEPSQWAPSQWAFPCSNSNRQTRKRCEICSNLTINTPKQG